MHTIQISISTTKYFNTQNEMAVFLDIKNSSKKSINSRCIKFGYGCNFSNYYGKFNLSL